MKNYCSSSSKRNKRPLSKVTHLSKFCIALNTTALSVKNVIENRLKRYIIIIFRFSFIKQDIILIICLKVELLIKSVVLEKAILSTFVNSLYLHITLRFIIHINKS